nr:MAG TPA: minor tail protein [Caudoviricetes sp.]
MADGSVVIDTKIDTSGVEKGIGDIEKTLANIAENVKSISENFEKMINGLASGSGTANNFVSNLNKNLEKTADSGKKAAKEVKKAFDPKDISRLKIHKWTDNLPPVDEDEEMTDDERKALREKGELSRKAAKESADAINEEKEKVNELYESIKKTKEELKSLEKSGKWWGDDEYDEAAIKLQDLTDKVKQYKTATLFPKEEPGEVEKISGSVSRLGQKMESLAKKLRASGIAGLKKKVRDIGNAISALYRKLAQLAAGAIVAGLKKISSGIFGIHKSANKSTISLKNMLRYAFGIRSLFALLNRLRSAAAEGMQNLAKYDLATGADNINRSISELQSALTQLKNSFATAFAPILTVVSPILVRFINLISQAVTRVGMLIAALTGQKTFTKAIAVQENYAASLDNTANSAKKAAKALQGYLSPIDEINRYDDGSSSDSGIGSGGKYTGPSAGDMFEEVPIESSLKGIADKIKELIKDEDWEGLGAYMADGINKGLRKVYDAISWDNVGPKVTAFITAFTTTFNSLVDHIDWDLLGHTLGAGINTAVSTLNLLIGNGGIDFIQIGSSIAKSLRGAIREINWKSLGQLLGNKFMISWKMLSGFVQEMSRKNDAGITGWTELGKSIGTAMTGMFDVISLTDIADAIVGVINGAFEILAGFDAEFDWDAFQENLKEGIETAINGIEWKKNGKAFGDFLSNLCETLRGALTKDTFYDFGQGIGEFLGELPWGEILGTAASLIIGGLSVAFNGLVDGIKENHPIVGSLVDILTRAFLVVKIANITGISSLVELIVREIAKKLVTVESVSTVSNGITSMMNSATGSVSTFGGTLGKVFGTAGIVFAATEAAVGLAEGAASITEAIQGGNGELSQAGGYLHDYTGALENAKTITQDQAEELWKLIEANEDSSDLYDIVTQKLKDYGISTEKAIGILEQYGAQAGVSADFVEEMTDKLTLLGDGFSQTDGKIDTSKIKISDLKDVLYQLSLKSDDFSGSYKTVWDQLDESQGTLSDSKEAFDLIYTSLKDMGVPLDEFDEALKTEFPEAVTTAQTSAATGMSAASTAVKNGMAAIKRNTENAMSAASKSVTDNSKDIATASKDNWDDSASSVSTALGTMDTDTKDIMSKVMTTIQSYWSSVLINTNQIWEAVAKKIEKELGNALTAAERISSEIIGTMNNVISKVNGSIGNINNALSGIERSFTFTYNYTNPITKRPGTYRSWLNLPSVNTVPYLATGAVIPPRSEFLAVLGDQKNGRNLEAPENLLRQIVREESGGNQGSNTYNVSVSASGRNLLDIILEEGELRRNRNGGRNPFKLDE